jgi:hypothetical protein
MSGEVEGFHEGHEVDCPPLEIGRRSEVNGVKGEILKNVRYRGGKGKKA